MSFCPQLEQSQKEASDLLEQNRLLQDQLRVALGREQSAREGYVLQVGLRACFGPRGAFGGFSVKGPDYLGMCKACEQGQPLPHAVPLGSPALSAMGRVYFSS